MERNNVISFREYDTQGEMDHEHQALIEHSQDLIDRKVMAAVGAMFERVDDTLFDLADRASNNNEQNLYFDAMREMRIKSNQVKSEFHTNMLGLFATGMKEDSPGTPDTDDFDPGHLSLIEEPELEESLAVVNAVTKLSGSCHEALFALDKRMGCLLNDPELERHANPFSPNNICNAFREACQTLESGIEIRLIVFKLFEKHLVTALNEAYWEANHYLIENNILPQIKMDIRRQHSGSTTGAPSIDSHPEAATPQGEGGDVFAALQQLLAAQQGTQKTGHEYSSGSSGLSSAAVSGSTAAMQGAPAGAQTLPRVVAALTQLQQAGPESLAVHNIKMASADGEPRNVVHALRASGIITPANPVDVQTIDIVAMMFDYILDDAAVPAAIKAELGRLQIPVLKAALLDKALFSKKQHPVRKLLDRIANAAVGWEAEALGELVVRVEMIVERIVNEFDDDNNMGVFVAALADMEAFLEQQNEEIASRQERIARVLQGRDRIEAAKRRIRDAFAERMAKRPVPDFVATFLLRHWADLLLKSYLNEGEGSPAWDQNLKLVDDLIEGLAPKQSPEARRELIAMLPRILMQLKSGMRQIGLGEVERKTFLTMLAACHTRSVRPPAAASGCQEPMISTPTHTGDDVPDTTDLPIEPVAQPADQAQEQSGYAADVSDTQSTAELGIGSQDPDMPGSQSRDPDSIAQDRARQSWLTDAVIDDSQIEKSLESYFGDNETVMALLNTGELDIEEIELIDETTGGIDKNGSHTEGVDGNLDEVLAAEIEQVNALVPGTWLELMDEQGKALRVRLQWVSESANILNFSDRSGRVAIRKSVRGLALDIQQYRARILEQAPLFERAVGSVFGQLRRLGTAGQASPLSG